MGKTIKVKAGTRNGKVVKAHTRTIDDTKNPLYPKSGGLRELSKAYNKANKVMYMSKNAAPVGSTRHNKAETAYEKKKKALMDKRKISKKHAERADEKLYG